MDCFVGENRHRKPSIFPWRLWGFPLNISTKQKKSAFSYGFPMVFLWFFYGFPTTRGGLTVRGFWGATSGRWSWVVSRTIGWTFSSWSVWRRSSGWTNVRWPGNHRWWLGFVVVFFRLNLGLALSQRYFCRDFEILEYIILYNIIL